MKNIFILIATTISFSSCMIIGSIAGGKKTTFEKDFVLKQKSSLDQSKVDLKQVLYSDGWNKTQEEANKIHFSKSSSLIKELATSRINKITMAVFFSDERIMLQIVQHGNFKSGTEQNVDRTFSIIREGYEKL